MSWRRIVVLLLLASVAVLTKGALAQPGPPPPPMLGLPTFGFNPCGLPAGTYVFSNEDMWLQFWQAGGNRPAPRVDFARWQIVAVLLGRRPNPGYAVHFVAWCSRGEELVVHYEEWLPGPGTVWTAQVTYPFDMVAIPAGGPVRFDRGCGPRQGVITPVSRCLQAPRVNLAALSPCTPEQFTAFSDRNSWEEFWSQYGQGPAPQVRFGLGYTAVGVLGLPEDQGVCVSEVTRAGDCITVTLGPCDAGDPDGRDQHSLLLVVPAAPRVDFRWLPFGK